MNFDSNIFKHEADTHKNDWEIDSISVERTFGWLDDIAVQVDIQFLVKFNVREANLCGTIHVWRIKPTIEMYFNNTNVATLLWENINRCGSQHLRCQRVNINLKWLTAIVFLRPSPLFSVLLEYFVGKKQKSFSARIPNIVWMTPCHFICSIMWWPSD